jgi:hypothetical protein
MSSFGIDNQPLRYHNGKPIYLTLYLTLALTAGTVITLLLQAGGFSEALFWFFPEGLKHWLLWQPFTYVFVNGMSFFTPLGLLAFYFWAVEVEKFLGRRRLVEICAALLLAPVVCLSLFYLVAPTSYLAGDYFLLAGILVAFATLYPDLDYIGGWIPLKWFAFASIVCGSLMYFAKHQWDQLLILWVDCFLGFFLVRHARGHFDFKFKLPQIWRKKPKLRVLPRPAEARHAYTTAVADLPDEAEEELDALLDKIARSGMQSLTGAERSRLEILRQKLLKKGS